MHRTWLPNRLTTTGVGILTFWVVIAASADFIAPYPQQGLLGIPAPADKLLPPSLAHPLGTTELGLDLLSRVIYGTRTSLLVALVVTIISVLIGFPLGVVAGFFGGNLDEAITRVTDVFLAFPTILMAMLIVTIIGPGLDSVIIALGATRWPWFLRVARAQAISLRNRNFVLAAKGMGQGRLAILYRHISLNALPPLMILASTDLGFVILADAGLSFLGIGVTPPTADWGLTIANSVAYFPTYWWYATFPGLALFLLVTGFALIGDSLSEYIDPKLRKTTSVWVKS